MKDSGRSDLRHRQIHLDFHTSEHIKDVGRDFNPDQFVGALKKGNVNSVTVFSRCHHGWAYYPSGIVKQHPHLSRNLLGEMVAACRANDINVHVYTTVMWDELTARENPGWRVVPAEQEKGASLMQLEARWHAICISNLPYYEYVRDHALEVAGMFHPDGLFFDIFYPAQCVCPNCVARMEKAGLDPLKEEDRTKNGHSLIKEFTWRMTGEIHERHPRMRLYYNGHICKGDRERYKCHSHLEIESLPTGGWGYDHFPLSARYVNTMNMEYLGMTGKFHTSWGEFGGFKRPAALEYECCLMSASGARCSVGDQLHPGGKMDEATYDSIAPAYTRVAAMEKYLAGARPLSEIAMFSSEARHGKTGGHGDEGCSRMLLESQMMFDVIDDEADFGMYKLVILPDDITLGPDLAEKFSRYLESGGKIIMSGTSGMTPDLSGFALKTPWRLAGECSLTPGYLLARPGLDKDLPSSPFVIYRSFRRIEPGEAEILAESRLPFFNREWNHFSSHQHTPFDPAPPAFPAAVVASDNIAYVAFPLFEAYFDIGQPLMKYLLRGLVRRLLPDPRLQVRMPSSGRVSLMRQDGEKRTLLHLLHAQPQLRGCGVKYGGIGKIEIIEDTVPIYNVACSLSVENPPKRVFAHSSGKDLDFEHVAGKIHFTVPKVDIHEIAVVED